MRQRPIEFRTVLLLTVVLGLAISLIIHFVVLSSGNYNWLSSAVR
ncbi:MAG: light-harvesting protein [Herpetosiphonaceae bacterium]|nr:light-harvesting protein [Herpetosiphonaceae bacterium]